MTVQVTTAPLLLRHLVIDEIQLAPELLRAIKVLVDLDPRPGRFLLTGSSRILALRSLPDALPGRMEVIELWPFAQGEIDGGPDLFVDSAFRHGAAIEHSSRMRKRDYLELAVVGGFPEGQGDMLRLLSLLAGRVSGLLVPDTLAGQAGIPRTTLSELRTSRACGTSRATLATSSSQGMSCIPASRPSLTAAGSKQCRWTRSGSWHRNGGRAPAPARLGQRYGNADQQPPPDSDDRIVLVMSVRTAGAARRS